MYWFQMHGSPTGSIAPHTGFLDCIPLLVRSATGSATAHTGYPDSTLAARFPGLFGCGCIPWLYGLKV